MIRQLTTLSILALVAGCTPLAHEASAPTYDTSRNPELLSPDLYPEGSKQDGGPEVRYSRYTLVNTAPETEQRDLMAQIIDVSIPGNMHPTVQDAMQYVVDRSGYSLCPSSTEHVNILFTRPLPAAQYKLGPMTLRNTLQVLAGPAWQVKVNEVTRAVCFVLRPGYQLPEPPRPAPVMYAAQSYAKAAPTAALMGYPPLGGDSSALPAATVTAAPVTPPLVTASSVSVPLGVSSPKALPVKPEQPQSAVAKDRPLSPASDVTKTSTSAPAIAPAKVVASSATSSPVPAQHSNETQTAAQAKTPVATAQIAPPVVPVQTWDAVVGSTLRKSVEEWAKRANWHVIWQPDDLDYPIEASLHFKGTFAEAVAQVFPLYDGANRSFTVDGNIEQRMVFVSERKK